MGYAGAPPGSGGARAREYRTKTQGFGEERVRHVNALETEEWF